jgi:hypothetical protein
MAALQGLRDELTTGSARRSHDQDFPGIARCPVRGGAARPMPGPSQRDGKGNRVRKEEKEKEKPHFRPSRPPGVQRSAESRTRETECRVP